MYVVLGPACKMLRTKMSRHDRDYTSHAEHLQSVVVLVGDHEPVLRVKADVARIAEHAGLGALAAKAVQEGAQWAEYGYPMIPTFGNVYVSVFSNGDAKWVVELSWSLPLMAKFLQ